MFLCLFRNYWEGANLLKYSHSSYSFPSILHTPDWPKLLFTIFSSPPMQIQKTEAGFAMQGVFPLQMVAAKHFSTLLPVVSTEVGEGVKTRFFTVDR